MASEMDIRIDLDKGVDVFFPGQILAGQVVISLKEPVKARSVSIAFLGLAKTRWTLWEKYSANRSTKSEAIPYWAEVVYADLSCTLWTPPPNSTSLQSGSNTFPFSFLIPCYVPPTFEGNVGFIRYSLKVKVDRPWMFDIKKQMGISITPHFDLTSLIYASNSIQKNVTQQLNVLCFKHGSIEMKVSIAKCGYVPGESILLKVDVNNKSDKSVSRIEASLVQATYYTAHRHATRLHYGRSKNQEVEHRAENRVVVQYVEYFKVAKHSVGTYHRMLAIPPIVPSFNVCEIVQVSYYFQVKAIVKGKLKNSVTAQLPILIGTKPTRPNIAAKSEENFTRDYLTPPLPTIPDDSEHLHFAESLFGKCTMAEGSDQKMPDYTPKYIFYSDIK